MIRAKHVYCVFLDPTFPSAVWTASPHFRQHRTVRKNTAIRGAAAFSCRGALDVRVGGYLNNRFSVFAKPCQGAKAASTDQRAGGGKGWKIRVLACRFLEWLGPW